jgi:cytochrome oxidase Cu insertion factor (SCO1/SenC/PrrC family)
LRGRVVVIDFFQLWCPGSNEFSVPLFKSWQDRFAGRDDVMLVSIETVFEGHDVQTPERLRAYVRESGLTHPVGIDAYAPDDPVIPVTMKRFGTEGTPQVVIVDKRGKIRFSHFGRFDPLVVEAFIERLTRESDRGDGTSPSSRRPGRRRR